MADTDYSFGNLDESPQEPDNRSDYRLTARAKAILELESQVPGTDTDGGRNEECRIRDISAQGMSLLSRESLPVGALLSALVLLDHHSEPFKLTVEVIWCQPDGSRFLVGVKILESDETAYVEWVEAVASALASD
ncbi:MAG TPA: PilZ domain-containing protein [Marinobacter sp.]|nr:PilZ domain-containing protein [Marinobacter sp.]